MDVCKVVGQAVSTAKDDGLRGLALLLVREAEPDGTLTDKALFAATNTVGAGDGELVLVARGSAARATQRTRDIPADAAIVAILDSLSVEGSVTYRKT